MKLQNQGLSLTLVKRPPGALHTYHKVERGAQRIFSFKNHFLTKLNTLKTSTSASALPGIEILPSSLLLNREAIILWDVENVPPWSPVLSIPVQVHRVKFMIHSLGGSIECILAAMNHRSILKLRHTGQLEMLMMSGVNILCCSTFSDAADRDLIDEAYLFCRDMRMEGSIVVISNDTGFSEILRYASSCGCITISMAPHKIKRTDAAMSPGPKLHKAVLPNACHAAVMWEPLPLMPTNEEEQNFLRQCLEKVMLEREKMMKQPETSKTGSDNGTCTSETGSDNVTCTMQDKSATQAGSIMLRGKSGRILKPSLEGLNAIHVQVLHVQGKLPAWQTQPMPGAVTQAWLNQAYVLPTSLSHE
ncbi:hypothetical protein CEUSTIGMA_g9508.t1 [Chlamydomonas eustigma]|uniref:NYN domain-containing protein n=1 Tax=Chlamydomonas eustigma TaxID=1157962 RepID=A0A250XH12_9CHLO|nr:hypothetical protein CEUSTIGMA_g9508.t1 [Chlamydomonas eustigma]|eukprot:GAX82080.1 hypothetical protein CEUSTIGMA_g9508.t1 [Chlamydomonas eustigma]